METEPNNNHIMIRCPHCDQRFEAEIGNNELVKDGITITPLPVDIPTATDTEQ